MRRILVSLLNRRQKHLIYCSQVSANPLLRACWLQQGRVTFGSYSENLMWVNMQVLCTRIRKRNWSAAIQGWYFNSRSLKQFYSTGCSVPACWRNNVWCQGCTCNDVDHQLNDLKGNHCYESSEFEIRTTYPWSDWIQNGGRATWHWRGVKAGNLLRSIRTSEMFQLWKNQSSTWKVLDRISWQETQKEGLQDRFRQVWRCMCNNASSLQCHG